MIPDRAGAARPLGAPSRGEFSAHLAGVYGAEVSTTTISTITDSGGGVRRVLSRDR
ncbi:hypothetical protein ACWDG1_41365 [Streptomyces sp. NPDC001177]